MQINKTNLNFTSRNALIRQANDLTRKINLAFPRVSESQMRSYKSAKGIQSYQLIRLRDKIRQMRNLKYSQFFYGEKTSDKVFAFLNPVKERKVGNCAESAQISAIAAKLNGINDAYIAILKTKGGTNLDHSVLYVPNNNKPYVIDAWLNEADYVSNMFQKYTSEYQDSFFLMQKNTKASDLTFVPYKDSYTDFLKKEFSKEDKETLIKLYPQLLV